MGVVNSIYCFFTDENIPLSRKMKLVILGILLVVLVDNHYGFSHTIINSYKVDYMMKLEMAKLKFSNDAVFVEEVDRLIETENNRIGIVEKFYALLIPKVDDAQKNNEVSLYSKILKERDPQTHTITGAFLTLLPMLSGIIAMMLSIFSPKLRSFDIFFWSVIMVIVSAAVSYYISLAWALIDPICGHVWINYVIQMAVNFIILILLVGHLEAYGHRWDNKIA